jgi:large subunit ribosomal protein L32e
MKGLLEKRKKLKAKKPTFLSQDSNRISFKSKWRKPRGIHNKRRLNKAGHQKNPSQGYRSPKLVRGLHTSGLNLITINNLKDIQNIDPKTQLIEFSSTIGLKNKLSLLETCKEKKLQVSNVKDIDKFIKEAKAKLEFKRKTKTKKAQDKKKAKKEAEKKVKEKEKKETSEEKQDKVKEDVLKSKKETNQGPKEQIPKQKDNLQAKAGHQASSVPGTKQ